MDLWQSLTGYFTEARLTAILQSVVVLAVGLVLTRLLRSIIARTASGRLSAQSAMIVGRTIQYLGFSLVVAVALQHAGVDLSILLGAAGILTVALGFAAQTSASNLISGLFLMGEAPFQVGDVIRLGTTTGTVTSIDLMSVKLRTFDNLLVRIPNETLLKAEITNLTRYPIRRIDVLIGVAYKEDLERVRDVLVAAAEGHPRILDEPKPVFIFQGFGASSLDLQFSVWCAREGFLEVKTQIHMEIKKALDAAGIEIPFPHVSLHAGSATDPFPVRHVEPSSPSEGAI